MTRLEIKFEPLPSADQYSVNSIVANIYPTGKHTSEQSQFRNLAVPSGQYQDGHSVDLQPGSYIIEAELPDGEIIEELVDIAGGPEEGTLEVVLRSSGRESNLNHVIEVPSANLTFEGHVPEVFVSGSPGFLVFREFPASWFNAGRPMPKSPDAFFWLDPDHSIYENPEEQWDWILTSVTGGFEIKVVPGESAEVVDREVSNPLLIASEGILDGTGDLMVAMPSRRREARLFAGAAIGGKPFVMSVPIAWVSAKDHKEWPIKIETGNPTLSSSFGIIMGVTDPVTRSALAYATTGSLSNAAALLDVAKGMLFEKIINPFAAAAGGYILLATDPSWGKSDWHAWVYNLYKWFPEIPDGAILYATLLAKNPKRARDGETARDIFLTAFSRGLPYCSVGFKWLLDGLTPYMDEDPKIAEIAKTVQRVSWRVDMQQPFTVVRLGKI